MKTRETKKNLYISNFVEHFMFEMRETIFAEESERKWIEFKAGTCYLSRKEHIKDKADALMFGILDAKADADRIKSGLY